MDRQVEQAQKALQAFYPQLTVCQAFHNSHQCWEGLSHNLKCNTSNNTAEERYGTFGENKDIKAKDEIHLIIYHKDRLPVDIFPCASLSSGELGLSLMADLCDDNHWATLTVKWQ